MRAFEALTLARWAASPTAVTEADAPLADEVYDYLAENYPASVLGWVRDADWSGPVNVDLSDVDMARRPGGRDQAKVEGIAQAIRDGREMDPVVLVRTPGDEKLVIADGFHRTLATKRAGQSKISAYVGEVGSDEGPWDRAMHDAKLNTGVKESLRAYELLALARWNEAFSESQLRAPKGSPLGGQWIRGLVDGVLGRHGKRGGGPVETAAPAKKVAAEILASGHPEALRDVASVMDGTYGGLRAQVHHGEVDESGMDVWLHVFDPDGKKVGKVHRVVARDRDGGLYANHRLLELDPDVQGQGFAHEFNAALEEWYRQSGVQRIELHADISVGGYAWARQGYDFREGRVPEEVLARMSDHARGADGSVERLLARAETGEPLTPFEISQVGRKPGDVTWPGKEIMLGSNWYGVKWLEGSTPRPLELPRGRHARPE